VLTYAEGDDSVATETDEFATETDEFKALAAALQVLSLLALLVQKYKY
jgi:hypothetical protein